MPLLPLRMMAPAPCLSSAVVVAVAAILPLRNTAPAPAWPDGRPGVTLLPMFEVSMALMPFTVTAPLKMRELALPAAPSALPPAPKVIVLLAVVLAF